MISKKSQAMGIAPWDPSTETFSEWTKRQEKAVADERSQRRARELFRLALVNLPMKRYAIGVEHGVDPERGVPDVHAYVVCKDCYRKPGLEEPRALVMDGKVKKLFPDNELLAVGADMMEVIGAMMDHEKAKHGGRPH